MFDAGGVLVTFPVMAIGRFLESRGLPPDTLSTTFTKYADPTSSWAGLERGDLTFQEGTSLSRGSSVSSRGPVSMPATIMQSMQPVLVPEVLAAADKLRTAGHKIAVVTNNWDGAFCGSAMGDIRKVFNVVIESYKIGLTPPFTRPRCLP